MIWCLLPWARYGGGSRLALHRNAAAAWPRSSCCAAAAQPVDADHIISTYPTSSPAQRRQLLARLAALGVDAAALDAHAAAWQRLRSGGGGGAAAEAVVAAEHLRRAARPGYLESVLEPLARHAAGPPLLADMRADALALLAEVKKTGSSSNSNRESDSRAAALALARMERDLRRLLSLAFSGGALRLETVAWPRAGAALRATLAAASVHPAKDEDDAQRRAEGNGLTFVLRRAAAASSSSSGGDSSGSGDGDPPLVVLQAALCQTPPRSMREILGAGGALCASNAPDSSSSSSSSGGGGGDGSTRRVVACFYSITSLHAGLAGLDLGRTTIYRAAQLLAAGAARTSRGEGAISSSSGGDDAAQGAVGAFVTLSPVPGFRRWLEARLAAAAAGARAADGGEGEPPPPPPPLLTAAECELAISLLGGGGESTTSSSSSSSVQGPEQEAAAPSRAQHAAGARAMAQLLSQWGAPPPPYAAALAPALERLAAEYLARQKRPRRRQPGGGGGDNSSSSSGGDGSGGGDNSSSSTGQGPAEQGAAAEAAAALDPVAHFHLANGAELWRVNVGADDSPAGARQAYGVMANYTYDLDRVSGRAAAYAATGAVAASRAVEALLGG